MAAGRTGFAVFGMGRMGLLHVKNIIICPRASLKWIVTENVEDARQLAEEYGVGVKCTTPENADKALSDPSVDVVMIVTPTDTHEMLIKKSLNADKAVICEKPLTPSVESTRECYDLAAAKGLPLFCAFHRRFDPSMSKVYRCISSGQHGRVRTVKTTSRDYPFPPIEILKYTPGIFKDATIHDLDLCSWMAGSKPKTVFAQGVAYSPELKALGDNEQVFVVITYENDTVALIDNGRWAPFGYDNRLEVLCEETMLSVNNKEVDQVYMAGGTGSTEPRIDTGFLSRYIDAYRNELEHFIDVLNGKAEMLVTKNDVIQAMRLAELCQISFNAKKVVDYSE